MFLRYFEGNTTIFFLALFNITFGIKEGPDTHNHTTFLIFLPRKAELVDDVSFVVCSCVVLMSVVSSRVVTFGVVGTKIVQQ